MAALARQDRNTRRHPVGNTAAGCPSGVVPRAVLPPARRASRCDLDASAPAGLTPAAGASCGRAGEGFRRRSGACLTGPVHRLGSSRENAQKSEGFDDCSRFVDRSCRGLTGVARPRCGGRSRRGIRGGGGGSRSGPGSFRASRRRAAGAARARIRRARATGCTVCSGPASRVPESPSRLPPRCGGAARGLQ